MQDTLYALTVFDSEGCDSCHRFTGFDSNVGFKIEKETTPPSFTALQEEKEWFSKLIPEQIRGSTLAKVVEAHADEIDARIADDVRKNGLLEEIEKSHPKLIESFYTPFKFAARAKNAHFKELMDAEKDPAKKDGIAKKANAWKKRIHDLMFIYAQEYGLGRLIGPRPNWSGIFRSDEWLMEHFKNPSAHVPRSIMPVFPFDETKFYALTLMLDNLALQNRNATRKIWQNQGFSPELAYNLYCAQCHGDFLQGNGPVAPWIYPIPKNLNNAEFLRNLTRERVIDSIKYGIKGTPMPPWGEAAQGKTDGNTSPVLTDGEIQAMANWLFSTLPGGQVIRGTQDVLKWNYSPEEILKELQKEGNFKKFKESDTEETKLNKKSATPTRKQRIAERGLPVGSVCDEFIALAMDEEQNEPNGGPQPATLCFLAGITDKGILASLTPQVAIYKNEIATLFDVVENPTVHPDLESYYIKKKYYTPENIDEGQRFFEMNCAACHGKDADGSGLRSSTMAEAKPRMLTNVDWIKTRDDLRLLRSIKFGVPGTSMSPWGDLTSSLQRLQLVMFIRSLSEEKTMREQLNEVTYRTFDATEFQIERARKQNYAALLETQKEYAENKSKIKKLVNEIKNSSENATQLYSLYEKESSLKNTIEQLKGRDAAFLNLKSEIKAEEKLYNSVGQAFIQNKDTELLQHYLKLIDSLSHRYKYDGNQLAYEFSKAQELELIKGMDSISATLAKKINNLEKQISLAEKNDSDPEELTLQLDELRSQVTFYTKLKDKLASTAAATVLLREKEQLLIPLINPSIPKSDSQNG
jgi:mono/diheme cytochrome c family protein